MSRTLIISDTHIGDKRFINNEKVIDILDNEIYDRLVLNGDIVDLWSSKITDLLDDPLYKKICELSEQKEVIWVLGNHDYGVLYYAGCPFLPKAALAKHFLVTHGGHRVLVIHGHQVYSNSNMSRMNRLMFKIGCFISNTFSIDFQKIYTKTSWYKKYVYKKRNKIIDKYKGQADTIIIGHTHLVGMCNRSDVVLFDIGSSVWTNSYAIIENGEVCINLKK